MGGCRRLKILVYFFNMSKLLKILAVLFLFENIFYFHFLFLKKGKVLSYQYSYSDSCSLDCQEVMDQKIAKALSGLSSSGNVKSTAGTLTTNYIPLGNGGSTTVRDWSAVSGSEFNFDLADYPANVKVYWNGNLKAETANSRCYARIYDKDNYRAVDYSEQSTTWTAFENLTSQPLSIWKGPNHYQVEIKSLNGITCYLESPRLVVKY